MGQELKTNKEIKDYVDKNFKVDFPMSSKIEVNGEETHPIYKYLKYHSKEMKTDKGIKNIPWNFAKFLVDKDGKVMAFFGPKVKPDEILNDIKFLLNIKV